MSLILTPVFGIQELLSILDVFHVPAASNIGIFIKVLKDILLLLIFLVFVFEILMGGRFLNNLFVWSMLTIILISFFITFVQLNPFIAVLGLRAFSSFLFIFIAYKYFDMGNVRLIVKILSFVLILEFCAASIQAFYGLHTEGSSYFGTAARPFGTFVHPWSFAVFICIVLCFRMGFDVFSYKSLSSSTWIFVLISALFVFLSGSGAGLIALTIVLIIYFFLFGRVSQFLKAAVFPAVSLIPLIVFLNLIFFTNRPHIYRSVQTRIDILVNYFSSATIKDVLIGKGLGVGSNAALSFLKFDTFHIKDSNMLFIADTLITSVLSQAGILFLCVFIFFNFYLLIKAFIRKHQGIHPIAVMIIPVAMVASLGNNIIELFPVNWLLCVVYGLMLKKNDGEDYRKATVLYN